MNESVRFVEICPECGKSVEYRYDNGFVPSPEITLVADWIYHSECWDKLVEENPIGDPAGDVSWTDKDLMPFDYFYIEDC